MLLEIQQAQTVLDEALNLGASFADIFVERDQRQTASILDSKIHRVQTGIDFGIGIRLIFSKDKDHEVFYGYTNINQTQELIRLVRELAAARMNPTKHKSNPLQILKTNLQPLLAAPLNPSLEFLKELDVQARKKDAHLTQVEASVLQRLQEVSIYNTEGLATSDQRPYLRFMLNVTAEKAGERNSGFVGPGILGNFDQYSKIYNAEDLAQKAVHQAVVSLGAPGCPAGKMPVVLANGFGGVIFHEACGHLLETTSVQKKASVFHDKLGERIAHPCVNAVDDGTLDSKWGSITYDDEGIPTQKTQLIKDGVLTHFIVDKVGSMKTGYNPTGSGRRQNYRYSPASRMRNTFIENGKDSFDDMIASIDEGIFCQSLGGGSVNPGTGEFNFAAIETYRIQKGKITHPVKGATLIGTGPEILQKISMVGNDLELSTGMCGSVSGAVPVTVGQPSLKIDEILVGGTK
jgi:TldD protein